MAEPQVFEIKDNETGKVYQVRSEFEDATYDEAIDYISGLTDEERSQFEYTPNKQESAPQTEVSPAPVSVPSGPVASPNLESYETEVRVPLTKTSAPESPTYEQAIEWVNKTVPQKASDYRLGIDQNLESDNVAFTSRDEKLFLTLANDPNVPIEYLNQFLQERKKVPYTEEQLEEIRLAREEGVPYGTLEYGDPAKELLGEAALMEDPGVGSIGAGLESAFAENPMGMAQRFIEDLFNVEQGGISDEMIRQRYPGITDEGLEQVRDLLMGELRRREINNAQHQLEVKDVGFVTQLITGLIGSASPLDAVPLGRGLTVGQRVGQAYGINTAFDAAMQGQDIAYGAQDEFSPERSVMAGVTGAALQGVIEIPAAVARRLGVSEDQISMNEAYSRVPRPMEPLDQTIPSRTTHDRRTQVYRQETEAAQVTIQDRANSLTEEWTNAPEITAEPDFRAYDDLDNDALGVYRSDGTVLLNTESILSYAEANKVTPDDVVRSVVFHEGLGHHGLASKYGEDLEAMMTDFYVRGDPTYRNKVDAWMKRTGVDDPALAAEEVLAEMSESGLMPVTMKDRLVAFFRGWVRRIPGFDTRLKYTDNEIRTLLGVAQRKVTEGAPDSGGGSSDKYMVTYHGAGKDFDRFDHSFMGTGEGAQVYGWGTYLSESRGIAESYRNKLSDRVFTWRGNDYNIAYNLRNEVKNSVNSRFDNVNQEALDDWITFAIEDGVTPVISRGSEGWNKEIGKFLEENFKFKSTGKLYEVEVPDDAKWLEWEEPLSSQPDVVSTLKDSGYEVVDYPYWNMVQRDAYEARAEYNDINFELQGRQSILDDPQALSRYSPEEIERLEIEADELFQQLQSASIKRNRAVDRAKKYLHEDMAGEDVYSTLATNLGSDQKASEFLNSLSITGNRYLADNFRKGQPRRGDGTDTFNYVTFSDQTPVIRNKYMRPYRMEENNLLLELNDAELFETMNGFDILDRIIPKNSTPVISFDQLQAEAVARKVPPSALLRLTEKEPGYLARSLFMHDVALVKAGERVAELTAKINSGNYTMADKDRFLRTITSYEELTHRIFGMGSEFGLALRAMQEVVHTKKKLTTLRDALKEANEATPFTTLDDPATFEKFARQIAQMMEESTESVKKGDNPFLSTLNLPRALMSSMDLSAPLRQGIFFIGNKQYFEAAADMHKLFFSDKQYYDELMSEIASRPTYRAMVEAKIAFSSVDNDAPLSAREEDFQTALADSVPGVARSNRAFSGFRNKLSADMFDSYFELAQNSGANVGQLVPDEKGVLRWEGDTEALTNLKNIAALVNAGTGRGNLPKVLEAMSPVLNAMLFSPRLIASRIHLLNPVTYYKLPKGVRKAAILRASSVGSMYTMALSALSMAFPDIEVDNDPRSSDFGKVQVGNTRFDVLGGFGQYITLGARIATGQKVSSSGKIYNIKTWDVLEQIHEDFRGLLAETGVGDETSYAADKINPAYQDNLFDVTADFLGNKLSPNASYLWYMSKGENFEGEDFDAVDEALSRIMPMYFQDMAELFDEQEASDVRKTVGMIGGMYGVGVSTYLPKSLDPKQELEAPETFEDKEVADGENDYVIAEGGTITLKPEAREMWQDRVNLYFNQIMDYEMSAEDWPELSDRTKADIIKEARDEARRETKKDMVYELGVK